jgi:hypothetical protein
MTAGVLVREPVAAFLTAAAWTLLSVIIQAVRLVQATGAARRGEADMWLK